MNTRAMEWVVVAQESGVRLMKNLGERNAYCVRVPGQKEPDFRRGIGRQQAVMTYRMRILDAKQEVKA